MLEGECVMKRLNCTVFDKRGVNGDCMEFHAKGKYLRYTEANAQVEALVWKCDKQEKRIAELEKENILLKRVEEIFNASPDLTFDCCKRLFEQEFEAHNLEQQAEGIEAAANDYSDNLDATTVYLADLDCRVIDLRNQAKALKEKC
jgi:phage shock protein A